MNAARQAIIFDWNGTVIDDAGACLHGTNAVLAHYGCAPIAMETLHKEYKIPFNITYKSLGIPAPLVDAQIKQISDIWVEHYEQACADLQLRTKAAEVLEQFQKARYKVAVLSNYSVKKIEKQAKRLFVLGFFDAILAHDAVVGCMISRGKGARLKVYVEQHKITQALVIGDTAEEIEIAQEQGFCGVAITGGMASEEALRAARPDFLIQSLEELPDIAQKAFGTRGAQ